jgi:small ligand-binding sensory domain FIST
MHAGVERLAGNIGRQLEGRPPALVLQFDCAGRGKTMFRQDQKSRLISHLQELVDAKAPWIGFFTYGEIGPVDQHNYFHNYTAVVATLY